MQMTSEISKLVPDLAQTRKFLRAIIGNSDQTCFQVFGGGVKAEWQFEKLRDCADWLIDCNRRGAGVYFVVNYADGNGRAANNITRVRALFVDLDGAPLQPILDAPVKPHIILESSPGRYQVFWRCKGVSTGDFTPIQKALIRKFNGDPSCKDLGRVMRVAGFWHLKKEPFLSRIYAENIQMPVDKDALIEGLGLDVNWLDERPGFEEAYDNSGNKIGEGNRHREMKNLSVVLRRAGLTGKRLHDAVLNENNARCDPALPESEIAKLTAWANKRVQLEGKRLDPLMLVEAVKDEYQEKRKVIYGNEFKNMKLPEVKWIIRDLLPQGLTILAGAPKVGKSWLAQQLALSVAKGEMACGTFPCNVGTVLHLALEDNAGRLFMRMKQLLNGQMETADIGNYGHSTMWDLLPEAITGLEQWILDQTNPRLIVVDTFQKIRNSKKNDNGVYAQDYLDVGQFHHLASRHGIAIILVHHKRKADALDPMSGVSGSSGITGAADSIWLFDRPDRMEMMGSLQISGRDVSDRHYYFRWSNEATNYGWIFAGDGVKYEQSEAEIKFLSALLDAGHALTCQEISDVAGISRRHSFRISDIFREKKYIEKSAGQYGKYILTPAGQEQLQVFMRNAGQY